MNIIVAGIMGRYPYGGVAWCSLMYLLGLRRLGHRVWYLEDTGECNFDPVANTIETDPTYAVNFIRRTLESRGLADAWCYVDYTGKYYGRSRPQWQNVCRDADLFLNLSGGCWFWRDEYAAIPHSAFIDSDPAFTQLAVAKGNEWYVNFFRGYDALFTFGRNIGTDSCDVPTDGWRWDHTWQPVVMDLWRPDPAPPRDTFTTIMSWVIESFKDIGGNKDREFERILSLPGLVNTPLEIALATRPPQELLRSYGWNCRDAFPISHDLDSYHNYIRSSLGEFSVAKHTYVSTRSGWFSDRTECYLAAGRPAVVQDTGFSAHLPTGEGLFAYDTMEQAADALEAVVSDWPRHSAAARAVAGAHFDSDIVLPQLLERATGTGDGSAVLAAAIPRSAACESRR